MGRGSSCLVELSLGRRQQADLCAAAVWRLSTNMLFIRFGLVFVAPPGHRDPRGRSPRRPAPKNTPTKGIQGRRTRDEAASMAVLFFSRFLAPCFPRATPTPEVGGAFGKCLSGGLWEVSVWKQKRATKTMSEFKILARSVRRSPVAEVLRH